jgi:hypothetical protein
MVLGRLIDRLPTTLRVILIRWFIYVFAALPGLMALRGQLDEAVGKRPWFQDAEMPLDMLNVTLVAAELSDGAGLLMLCALLAWFLQLIWLAGAVRVLDPNAESRKVLASGRPFLWRYLRIAFFALLAILVVHVGTKAVFESLATSAELQGKPLDVSIFDLNMWRGAILFFLFTLIGVFVFWARVITAATDEHKLRRVPRKILRVFRRHIGAGSGALCMAPGWRGNRLVPCLAVAVTGRRVGLAVARFVCAEVGEGIRPARKELRSDT